MTARALVLTTSFLLALAGCAPLGGPAAQVVPLGVLPSAAPAAAPLAPAALLAIADYAGEVPSFAQGRAEALYRWAAPREAALKYFPCTCGCEGEGHRSNWNCYVKEVRDDGVIVWDPMAAG